MPADSALQDAVLAWFDEHGRSLPWRDIDDAYAVLVSEIMLQQTQVSRVLPAYTAFLERFPTVEALAAAPRADVITAWKGLGYNRRAVALHGAAIVIVQRHDGVVPDDLAALEALPGIGAYTARAVLAFGFGHDVGPVDTNIRRILFRAVAGAALTPRALQAAADAVVPHGRGRRWSAALMDLGSAHCTATPRCDGCPLQMHCAWLGAKGQDPAIASGGRRRPPPFHGSDRFHRGRLLDALREATVHRDQLGARAQLDDPRRADATAAGLIADGLAEWDGDELRLAR